MFWDDFYKSAEENFLPDVEKHYFLITNHTMDKLPDNVTHIFYPHKNWSSIVVEKFHIIYSLKEKLADFAYTYSFNANVLFVRPVEQDIIPNASQRLVAALHPSFYK